MARVLLRASSLGSYDSVVYEGVQGVQCNILDVDWNLVQWGQGESQGRPLGCLEVSVMSLRETKQEGQSGESCLLFVSLVFGGEQTPQWVHEGNNNMVPEQCFLNIGFRPHASES